MSTDVMTNLHFWVALFLAGRCAWVLGAGALFELGDSVIGDRKSFLLGHSFFQAAPRQKALIASGACRCF